MRATFALIGVLLALGACGRFGIADNGETPPVPVDEAGTAHPDASTSTDADAAEADAPAPRPCADGADFCEDWETDTSLWDPGDSDAKVERNTVRPHAGLHSLDVQTPATTTKSKGVLTHRVSSTKRKGTFSAWIWVEEWAGKVPMIVIELGMEPSDSKTTRVMIQFTGDASDGEFNYKLVTQHDATSYSSTDNDKLKVIPQTWVKLTLDFDIDASTFKLTENEGPDPNTSFDIAPSDGSVTFGDGLGIDQYVVRVGLATINDSPTAHIFIDDLTLTLK